jgi:hypothetical protein
MIGRIRLNDNLEPWHLMVATGLVASAAVVASPVPAHGQNGAAHSDRLEWFEPLIGGVWQAEGEVPGAGRYTADRRYEWALDSTFVAVAQTMRFANGPTIEEHMMIGWDAVDQRIHVWSFASDGSYSDGYEVSGQDPRRWTAEGRTVGGRSGEWRITTFVYDDNAMSMLIEVRAGRDYESGLTMAFHRK